MRTARACVRTVDKGKAFKRDDACTVLSYNLLAPLYVRPIDTRTGKIQEFAAFKWVTDPAVLNWEMRRDKIRNELVRSEADIIFLQEIQFDVAPSEDKKVEKQWGYELWLANDEHGPPLFFNFRSWVNCRWLCVCVLRCIESRIDLVALTLFQSGSRPH